MGDLVRQTNSISGVSDDARLVELWLLGKSKNTAKVYRRAVASLRQSFNGDLRLVTLDDVGRWVETLTGSNNTKKVRIAAIKSLLSFAHSIGYLPRNPGAVIKLKRTPSKHAKSYLTPVQVAMMIESAGKDRVDGHFASTAVHLIYAGGLRGGEASGLTWGDLDYRSKTEAQLVIVGKGDKQRVVLLRGKIVERLRLIDIYPEGRREDKPVLGYSYRSLLRIVRRAGLSVGVGRVSPHWLRYAHATHASEAGAPIKLISTTLGHGSIATTDIYLQARPTDSSSLYLPV